MTQNQQAFILRIAPNGDDFVDDALRFDEICVGWSLLGDVLLNPELSWPEFRGIVKDEFYSEDSGLQRAGGAAGHLWRFIREMQTGDLVVVPIPGAFYVAQVEDTARFEPAFVDADCAHRRKVTWLNQKRSIPRQMASARLQSRMKIQGTSARATDLLEAIQECLSLAASGVNPSFSMDLQKALCERTLSELRRGRLDSYGFEHVVSMVLTRGGAEGVRVVARPKDKGADILATIPVAGLTTIQLAVQVKHHYEETVPTGANAVDELIRGIEAEGAQCGAVVTCGTFAAEAFERAEGYFNEKGIRIALVDGEQLAAAIVDLGLAGRT
jgi:predicted Mrr-cat superfamily restriction endonuclease